MNESHGPLTSAWCDERVFCSDCGCILVVEADSANLTRFQTSRRSLGSLCSFESTDVFSLQIQTFRKLNRRQIGSLRYMGYTSSRSDIQSLRFKYWLGVILDFNYQWLIVVVWFNFSQQLLFSYCPWRRYSDVVVDPSICPSSVRIIGLFPLSSIKIVDLTYLAIIFEICNLRLRRHSIIRYTSSLLFDFLGLLLLLFLIWIYCWHVLLDKRVVRIDPRNWCSGSFFNLLLFSFVFILLVLHIQNKFADFKRNPAKPHNISLSDFLASFRHEFHYKP